ncbi:PAS domain-containing hybrid sensor histidine kinase/response regulator [Sphingomonas sp. CFBP 8764]|uniref:PAS domain-containing hybrid sensor histidine kinase/response regulator n=1 Tax=Sphingomonas sp. CFBP 8764 TaxID=2775275 RepID=UPI001781A28F|nr:PAS domain-containing protein [Sphingomonas sp. CFBP 8764]MBD8552871.1 PAS domain-containing protein [Sphingomonas sp. CFBP 8764]
MSADAITPIIGGGDMGRLVRDTDWSKTPIGAYERWPQSMRSSLSMVLNTKGIAALYWGPDQWLLYNDAYGVALGDRHPRAFGRPMPEVLDDIGPVLGPQVARVLETGEGYSMHNLTMPMRRFGREEETIWTYSFSPIQGEGEGFAGVLLLATETTDQLRSERRREDAEAALQDLNANLEQNAAILAAERDQLWRLSRDPFVICDLEGRWVSASPVWTEILGWKLDELIGRTSSWMEHPDDIGRTKQKVVDVGGGEIMLAFINRFRSKEGAYRTFSWTAVAEGDRLYCVARDVTNDLARDEALRLYRDIVQSDASPVVAFDTDMRITAFNKAHSDAYRRVYGIEQAIGDSLLEQFVPEQVEAVRDFMSRTLAGESFLVREAFGDPDLEVINWQIAYNPLRDGDGHIVGGFHRALDITTEVRAQVELERTQDALRQSQKLEAIGQLTGGVAHDFNNLLTVIRGSVDLLRRENVTPEKRQRYLDAIGDTADRAAKLTGQLLAFARRQTLEPQVFEIADRFDAIADMLDSITGTLVVVRFELPETSCRIRADVSQFETALVNLVVNARDAMNGEGTITIRLRCNADKPAIRRHEAGIGKFVAVSLTDTGVGIAADDMVHIFEPFFTTKEVGKGTGLGLSQVFGFAKQSGGDVDVESVVGQGSTFTLYLPQSDEAGDEDATPGTYEEAVGGDGRYVLVVEDNISVGQFATQLLDDLGYRTAWVTSAEDALERLGVDGGGFDIVFSDVVMPGMGGVELARRLANDLPVLPVVLASGYSNTLAQGGVEGIELLRKPYSATQLSAALQRRIAWAAAMQG